MLVCFVAILVGSRRLNMRYGGITEMACGWKDISVVVMDRKIDVWLFFGATVFLLIALFFLTLVSNEEHRNEVRTEQISQERR